MDGERIGNYVIEGERGRDATGIVYEARHLVLPRRAIVKVMNASTPWLPAGSGQIAVQLLREACILEALEHPGTIRVYESGLLADRRPWFAHERVEGATVEDMLATDPLEPAHAVVLLRDIAEVLEHAHRRGVVHCGLRPDRIVITGRARGFPLCIADWSDARIHDTTSTAAVPTLSDYVAPELADGGAPDDRADVYSLGVIAYRALTGVMPFDGAAAAHDSDGTVQHVPTTVRCPDAPPELSSLVDQMLAADRWDRPSSAEVLAELVTLAIDLVPAVPRAPNLVRIRKPRWTPSVPMSDGDVELLPIELPDDDPTEKSS